MKKVLTIIGVLILIGVLIFLVTKNKKVDSKENEEFKIVTSFYPIYILTLNLTTGAENVSVESMTSEQVGCLHEYTLKTSDMLKMENADVFIENGKGLEFFLDKITKTYPNLSIIDSSKNIEDSKNAHVWVNVENYMNQINTIKNELIKLNPINKDTYERNANIYIAEINEELENLNGNNKIKAITFNETLEGVISTEKIDMTVVNTGHEESALSAQELAVTVDKMKSEGIKVIFVDKNEPNSNAEILKNETGAKVYELNSYTKGNIERNSYLNALRENIDVLNSIQTQK